MDAEQLKPLSKEELDELERLVNLPLNTWKSDYHWEHAAEYDHVFDRNEFGPPEVIRRLIAQARKAL